MPGLLACLLSLGAGGCGVFNPAFVNLLDPAGTGQFATLNNAPGHVVIAFVNAAEVDERLLAFLESTEGGNLILTDAEKRALRPRMRLRARVTFADGTSQTIEFVDPGTERFTVTVIVPPDTPPVTSHVTAHAQAHSQIWDEDASATSSVSVDQHYNFQMWLDSTREEATPGGTVGGTLTIFNNGTGEDNFLISMETQPDWVSVDIEVYTSVANRMPNPDEAVEPITAVSFASSDGLRRVILLNETGEETALPVIEGAEVAYYSGRDGVMYASATDTTDGGGRFSLSSEMDRGGLIVVEAEGYAPGARPLGEIGAGRIKDELLVEVGFLSCRKLRKAQAHEQADRHVGAAGHRATQDQRQILGIPHGVPFKQLLSRIAHQGRLEGDFATQNPPGVRAEGVLCHPSRRYILQRRRE